MDGYHGEPATAAALKLAPMTFVRPGEGSPPAQAPVPRQPCVDHGHPAIEELERTGKYRTTL